MSKSKSGKVTRDTPQLITDTFPEAVAKIKIFPTTSGQVTINRGEWQ